MHSIWHDGLTLRQWRLHNFKSVRDATVDLAPLTVVVGANSAGKSTLLQSIRAASQAALAPGSAFPLNGEQIRLGTYDETRWAGAEETDAAIGIGACFAVGNDDDVRVFGSSHPRRRFRPRRHQDEARLNWDVRLRGAPEGQRALTNIEHVQVTTEADGERSGWLRADVHPALTTAFTFGQDLAYAGQFEDERGETSEVIDLELRGGFPQRALQRQLLSEALVVSWVRAQQSLTSFRSLENKDAIVEPMDPAALSRLVAADFQHVLSEISVQQMRDYRAERRIRMQLRDEITSRSPLAVTWTSEHVRSVEDAVRRTIRSDTDAARERELPEALREFCEQVQHFLAHSVHHLGPLRFDPQVVYTTAPIASPGFIGAKGEYCAAVLQSSGSSWVEVPLPGPKSSVRRVRLQEAVDRWAAELQIGTSFLTTDQGRLGIQLSTRQTGLDLDLDLTSVGTGVSQLLPVLVMCLQAPRGSLLLIEQPELHLNPGVQQRLADFLLAIATSGRQLIVETHSDYLVSRLRRRTVEDTTDTVHKRIALVFAERTGNATTYRTVKPAVDGSMTEWPAGFFDEAAAESESILKALLDRRQTRRKTIPGT